MDELECMRNWLIDLLGIAEKQIESGETRSLGEWWKGVADGYRDAIEYIDEHRNKQRHTA